MYAGIELADYDSGKIKIDTPEFQELSELYQKLYQADTNSVFDKQQDIFGGYRLLRDGKILFSAWQDTNLVYFAGNLQALGAETSAEVSTIKTVNGRSSATIIQSVGINKNTQIMELAGQYLSSLLCYGTALGGQNRGLPVSKWMRKLHYNSNLEYYSETSWHNVDVNLKFYGSDSAFYDAWEETVSDIGHATFKTDLTRQNGISYSCMEPYYQGKASYQDCMDVLEKEAGEYFKGAVDWGVGK